MCSLKLRRRQRPLSLHTQGGAYTGQGRGGGDCSGPTLRVPGMAYAAGSFTPAALLSHPQSEVGYTPEWKRRMQLCAAYMPGAAGERAAPSEGCTARQGRNTGLSSDRA